MVSISELAQDLKAQVEFQQTPRPMTDEEYELMVVHGLKRLFIDTGRADSYDSNKLYSIDDELVYDENLNINEEEYIKIVSQMQFFQTVRASVNSMVSYSTDALSVTQGDKPYANITGTLKELENERRIVYYKMVPYTITVNDA
jgi:hypothetical protein